MLFLRYTAFEPMMQYFAQPNVPQLPLFHGSFSALFTLIAVVSAVLFVSWFIREEAKQ